MPLMEDKDMLSISAEHLWADGFVEELVDDVSGQALDTALVQTVKSIQSGHQRFKKLTRVSLNLRRCLWCAVIHVACIRDLHCCIL